MWPGRDAVGLGYPLLAQRCTRVLWSVCLSLEEAGYNQPLLHWRLCGSNSTRAWWYCGWSFAQPLNSLHIVVCCAAQELPDLKAKLLQWLTFWQASSNQAGSYLLLASAEVTLGVRTILQLLRRRLWTIQQQQHALGSTGSRPQQQQQQQHAMRQQQAAALQHVYDEALRLGAVRTLYDLGQATNAELLRDILQDSQVRGDPCRLHVQSVQSYVCHTYVCNVMLQSCVTLCAASARQCEYAARRVMCAAASCRAAAFCATDDHQMALRRA